MLIDLPFSNPRAHDERWMEVLKVLEPYWGDCWIAGGSVLKHYMGEPLENSDFDVWFSRITLYSRVRRDLIDNGWDRTSSSNKALTYNKGTTKIQLITWMWPKRLSVCFDAFDLSVCKFALYGDRIYTYDRAVLHAQKKVFELDYDNHTPSTPLRVLKYWLRGYEPVGHAAQKKFNRALLDVCKGKLTPEAVLKGEIPYVAPTYNE